MRCPSDPGMRLCRTLPCPTSAYGTTLCRVVLHGVLSCRSVLCRVVSYRAALRRPAWLCFPECRPSAEAFRLLRDVPLCHVPVSPPIRLNPRCFRCRCRCPLRGVRLPDGGGCGYFACCHLRGVPRRLYCPLRRCCLRCCRCHCCGELPHCGSRCGGHRRCGPPRCSGSRCCGLPRYGSPRCGNGRCAAGGVRGAPAGAAAPAEPGGAPVLFPGKAVRSAPPARSVCPGCGRACCAVWPSRNG